MEKFCSRCKSNKLITDFGKRKDSKDGYHGVCKECRNKSTKKWRESDLYKNRVYTEDDIINEKNRKRKYYVDNREDVLKRSKEYRDSNKDKYKEYKKNYYNTNREKLIKYSSNYHLNRIKNDNIYKFQCNIKCLIKNSIKYKGYKKTSKTNEILGCSISEFRLYIESKFENWMTWDNYGLYNGEPNYGWDLDHIKPSSLAESVEDIYMLNHYTNFQPLCSYINRDVKIDKVDY